MVSGLLGRTLGHSYSPQIHRELGNENYQLFEVEPENLESFLRQRNFEGLNVTIPYKKAVMDYLDELTPQAQAIGSVNTILRRRDGSLLGHNSDLYGFLSLLRSSGISVAGKKVLVLGSGGTSAMVVTALQSLGANPTVISRRGQNHYGNLHLHQDASVIVNTTPVGMYPAVEASPISLDPFPRLEGVVDVIYNPARTRLLQDAQDRGLKTANGLWMLVAQAKEAAEYFTGSPIADGEIPRIHHKLARQMENIALIGMPGCGKTTVGQLLAKKLGRKFVDIDQEIEKAAGKTIPEIFASQGEGAFRALESQVLASFGKQSGLVLATGGGCVTREENRPALRCNSRCIWLKRELSQLPTQGRPLSQQGDLARMYAIRRPWYESFSDVALENQGSPEETVQKILDIWEDSL